MEGGCYCGAIRYEIDGDAIFKAECHCRECQYISGGGPNFVMGVPEANFRYTKGTSAKFTRDDIDNPVTREFCGNCGTPILTRSPGAPGAVILKVGSLDEPADFGMPQVAIYMCDAQPFHTVPEGVAKFDKVPG
jgi:hypothetical protein